MKKDYKKEDIEEILLTIDVDKKQVDRIMSMKPRGKPIPIASISLEHYSIMLAYFDINKSELSRYILKARKIDKSSSTVRVKSFKVMKRYKELGIDIDDIIRRREEIKSDIAKGNTEKIKNNNEYERLSTVLSFFNIPSESLKAKLENINKTGTQTTAEYLKELYVLRELFLAKAKGDLATTQSEILYEVEEGDDGEITTKKIYSNKAGKKVVNIRTQSYLPDEKSIVAIRIIDDMIRTTENDNSIELTEDELTAMYDKYRENADKQRLLIADERLESV